MLQVDIFTVGVSGLDAMLLSWIDKDGIVLAPMDPWFFFSPPLLPSLATEWVRRHNLSTKNLRWLYWLPFDAPFNTFEWYPRWNAEMKRYQPLVLGQGPVKLPLRSCPAWFYSARNEFLDYYKQELPNDVWPDVLREGITL